MKKVFIFASILSLSLSLSSCDNNLESVLQTTSPVHLSFSSDSYQVERGEYLTIKCDVSCDVEISKKIKFSIQQDDNFISFVEEDNITDGSISISGKKIGKAKLIATSVDNPSCQTSIDIEVIKHISSLKNVWQNMNEKSNYTLVTTRKKDNEEESDSLYVLVSDSSILYQGIDFDSSGNEYKHPIAYAYDYYIYGYGIDKNGYAFEVRVNEKQKLITESSAIKTDKGYLTSENFKGFSSEMTSINDVGFFYGLQAINPEWLSDYKEYGNTYTIESNSDDINSAYAKYLIWGLMDPVGRSKQLEQVQYFDIFDFVNLVNISVKAVKFDEVEISMQYVDDEYTYTTKMKDIGTTSQDTILPSLKKFASKYVVDLPSLSLDLQLFENGVKGHNYIYTRELYWYNQNEHDNPYHATFYVYYTETYMFAYYSQDFVDVYNQFTGYDISVGGMGFLKKNDGIYSYTYNQNTGLSIDSEPIRNTQQVDLWNVDFGDIVKDYYIPNYFTASNFYQLDALYYFSDEKATNNKFNDAGEMYYSTSSVIFNLFCEWYLGRDFIGSDYYFGIDITSKGEDESKKIDTAIFFMVYSEDNITYKQMITPSLSSFGEANNNIADSSIKQEIAR